MIPAYNDIINRKVKVFISSTFSDMGEEREIIVNSVFPRLRETFRDRMADIVEVDLRWGITEEMVESGKVLEICIGEVLRCSPFFMGLIGERYGSSAKQEEIDALPEDLRKAIGNDVEKGVSITELEIRAGTLIPDRAAFSYFFLKPLDSFNEPEEAVRRLNKLRSKVVHSENHSYYSSTDELEELMFCILKDYIEKALPPAAELPYGDPGYFLHLDVLKTNASKFVPENDRIYSLRSKLRQDRKLYIFGAKGSGKTACMSHCINLEGNSEGKPVFFHYTSAGAESTHLNNAYYRLWLFLKDSVGAACTVINENYGDAVKSILINTELNCELLLFFDAVEQFDDRSAVFQLLNLADLNGMVRVVCSGTEKYRYLEQYTVSIEPLTGDQIGSITRLYLKKFGKTLDDSKLAAIKKHPMCRNPLFLVVMVSQLRMYGSHDSLGLFFAQLLRCDNVADLFEIMLNRLTAYFVQRKMEASKIYEVLSLIAFSHDGMSETELLSATGIPPIAWSVILSTIDSFIIEHDGLIKFSHDLIATSIIKRLKNEKTDYELYAESRIVSFFSARSYRRFTEVTYQLRKYKCISELADIMTEEGCILYLVRHDESLLISCLSVLIDKSRYIAEAVVPNTDDGDLPVLASAFCLSGHFYSCLQLVDELKRRSLSTMTYVGIMDQVARATYKLGLNRYSDAIASYRELCDFYKKAYPEDLIGFASRLFLSGVVYNSAGQLDKALEIYEYCARIFAENNVRSVQAAWAMDNLGNGYFKRGELQRSGAIGEEAIKMSIELCGEISSETAWAYCYAWTSLYASGDQMAAKEMIRKAYEIYYDLYMHSGTKYAWAAQNYGIVKTLNAEYDEAFDLYKVCVDINDSTIAPEQRPHVYSLTSYGNISCNQYLSGNKEEASETASFVLNQSRIKNGEEHIYTVNFMLNYGIITSDIETVSKAAALYETIGSDLPDLCYALAVRAVLLAKKGEHSAATEEIKRSKRILKERSPLILYLLSKTEDRICGENNTPEKLTELFGGYTLYLTHSNNSCMLIIPEI